MSFRIIARRVTCLILGLYCFFGSILWFAIYGAREVYDIAFMISGILLGAAILSGAIYKAPKGRISRIFLNHIHWPRSRPLSGDGE
jgi:hypothetical protein